ncbi:MAG: hypothetical protein KF779_09340 [Hyphomonadaceae bacterium]|nr:hypothetical protein [Hyphomonadaceae bacterium]
MAGLVRSAIIAAFAAAALSSPAQAQNASQAQELSNCAGAVAAVGGLDVLAYPRGASGEWSNLLGLILDRLNREEGVEGMTGRYAASAAKGFWLEQSSADRTAAANECRARYGG